PEADDDERLVSFRAPVNDGRDISNAGANPNSNPLPTQTTKVNNSTPELMPTSPNLGISPGPYARKSRTATNASRMPRIPPTKESTVLSVRSWRTILVRLAPKAIRTATSDFRAVALASSRLATFTITINSKSPIAPNSTSKAVDTSVIIHSFIGIMTPTSSGELGY